MSKLSVQYMTTVARLEDLPLDQHPEVALAGRSNAGKSSFINALAQHKVAHVSKTPGKTRHLNFYAVGDAYRLVDMPGYGYAARPGDEVQGWGELVESYLRGRDNLCGVILFIDANRDWSSDEEQLLRFLDEQGTPLVVAVTKTDRLNQSQASRKVKEMDRALGQVPVFMISSITRGGIVELESYIFRNWIKP